MTVRLQVLLQAWTLTQGPAGPCKLSGEVGIHDPRACQPSALRPTASLSKQTSSVTEWVVAAHVFCKAGFDKSA